MPRIRAYKVSCGQCEMLSISGVACHETGCPNINARWDQKIQEWIKQRKCFECGYLVDIDDYQEAGALGVGSRAGRAARRGNI